MTWPSLILHGRGVASHSAAGGFVKAIAVEGDTIVAVGSNGEIDAPCRPLTKVVDLAGRLIICARDVTLVHPSPAVSKACVATCLASLSLMVPLFRNQADRCPSFPHLTS